MPQFRFDLLKIYVWARSELATLSLIILFCGSLLAFIQIAEEVSEDETHALDTAVLLALRNPADHADPIGPPWLESAVKDITSLGSITVLTLLTLAAIGYLIAKGKRRNALIVAASVIGGMVLSTLMKNLFARPRPDLVAHLTDIHTMSFPSGHAMLSAATYLTLGALLARVEPDRRTRAYVLGIAIVLTMLIGLSRIYLGVHYPTDVLAGWCAGAAWAILCWMTALWLQGRSKTPEDPSRSS
ncbi:phosphatase PAP2 family protein [Methylobrevis pamukkalensis]|uniref:Undecaprenyl-diphosphatase BcrC n=1 Tax=Methylobrevis pamukkalensis TaxID=1439726 RepID=A0A1E3H6B4_9HYPH|nr:phosphatase PAP2 family protein [Methylobrevis pamukkalensis]ODN71854.1 Undecaprenyl-diphosphatase BcrC [Methylobrevis pamukkalensis]